MRIACIGNMNNIISPIAQYLAVAGHDVDLFLLYEYEHFKPGADYLNESDIKFDIRRLNMAFGGVMQISAGELEKALSGYDYYIGTDYAPALMARIGKKLDVFEWAGTDLFDWPFYTSAYRIPQQWEAEKIMTARLQLEGIREARMMPMSLNNDFILQTLKKIPFKNRIVPTMPFMYYPTLTEITAQKTAYSAQLDEDRESGRLILLQQSRQWWKSAPENISKGNDIFLKGVAQFCKKNPEKKLRLYLFEYGADVQASKDLINELGLADDVIWLPVMLRKEIMSILNKADIGVGQFGSESWYLYCSNAEILATCGVYLGYRNDAWYQEHNCELYPMLNANDPESVAAALEWYSTHPDAAEQLRSGARNWLRKYNETEFMQLIETELKDVTRISHDLSFSARFRILMAATGIQLSNAINRMILFSRIGFLKHSILEWKKI